MKTATGNSNDELRFYHHLDLQPVYVDDPLGYNLSDDDYIVMVINGLMCGFPLCCVIHYCTRAMYKELIFDDRDGIGCLPLTGMCFVLCPKDTHEWMSYTLEEPYDLS